MTDTIDKPGPHVVKLEPKNDVAASVEALQRNAVLIASNQRTIAMIRRAAYLAYIEAGFTADEALTLCTK